MMIRFCWLSKKFVAQVKIQRHMSRNFCHSLAQTRCHELCAKLSVAFWIQWEHVFIYATKLRLTNPIQDDGISLKETGLRKKLVREDRERATPTQYRPAYPEGLSKRSEASAHSTYKYQYCEVFQAVTL